jgi:hypothetical protein
MIEEGPSVDILELDDERPRLTVFVLLLYVGPLTGVLGRYVVHSP